MAAPQPSDYAPNYLKKVLMSVLGGLGAICSDLGDRFSLIEHYSIYERMGTWVLVLRKAVQQLRDWNVTDVGAASHSKCIGSAESRAGNDMLLRTIGNFS